MSVRKIADITKLSLATVSLALQNSPKIAAATRERVLAAARQIGYKPNAKVAELMSQIRHASKPGEGVCLGVISLYDTPRPWEATPVGSRDCNSQTGSSGTEEVHCLRDFLDSFF
jgi:hypothetical protein